MVKRTSIRTYLFLLVFGIAVPFILMLTYTILEVAREDAQQAGQSALSVAQLVAADSAQVLANTRQILAELADRPLVRAMDAAACDPIFKTLQQMHPLVANFIEVSDSGQAVCSADPKPEHVPVTSAERAWLERVLHEGKTTVSAPLLGRLTRRWVTVVASPVRDKEQRVAGAVAAAIDLYNYLSGLHGVTLPHGATITIVDRAGNIVGRMPDPDAWIGKNARSVAVVETVLNQRRGTTEAVGVDGVRKLYGFSEVGDAGWYVYVGIPSDMAYASKREILIRNSVITGVLALIVALLAVRLSKRISGPIRALSGAARSVAQGHLESIVPVDNPQEIATLARWFNHMVLARKRAESTLYEEKERAQVTLHSIIEGVITTNVEGRIEYLNRNAERLTGWRSESAAGRVLRQVFRVTDDGGHEVPAGAITKAPHEQAAAVLPLQGVLTGADKRQVPIEYSSAPIRAHDGNIKGAVITFHDISKRRKTQQALQETNERLRTVWDSIGEGLVITDESGHIESINPAAEQIFGYTEGELIGKHVGLLLTPTLHPRQGTPACKLSGPIEARAKRRDGNIFPIETETSSMELHGKIHLISVMRDITERKRAEQHLRFLANYDTLTDLPNRTLFRDRLEHAMAQANRNHKLLALMFLDLDRFKNINDTLGHYVGDSLLVAVVERLKAAVGEGDTVARLGGDEFTVIAEGIAHVEEAADLAQKILDSLAAPFVLDGREVHVTASIGIVVHPLDETETDVLITDADTAMYRAKECGRNNYQFYTADMNALALHRLELENQLRHALDRDEFVLHYQPQADIADGRIVGVEALLRWQHAELGLVPPGEFVPLLEDTGLIAPVGEWVLKKACDQAQAWHDAGFGDLRVAVNLSARQFRQQGLAKIVDAILRDSGLPPAFLELELTESMLMDNVENAITTLQELRQLGVCLSVDDFGTGYSSLSYLKRLPIDTLKIDSSFVRDVTTDADAATIVELIILLAHSLRYRVIAEGVETDDQIRFLRQYQCDEIQGYRISKPLAAQDVTNLLQQAQADGPAPHRTHNPAPVDPKL